MPPLWLALFPCPSDAGEGLGLWALRFTPRVVRLHEAWLLEVSTTLRLWGGLPALVAQMHATSPANATPHSGGTLAPGGAAADEPAPWRVATGPTALAALARGRAGQWWPRQADATHPAQWPPLAHLPLHTLDAARPHQTVLDRLGVHTWGQLSRLPRDGVARRWGQGLLHALDQALGHRPEAHDWLQPAAEFDQVIEWPHHMEHAQALMEPALQLLAALMGWLTHRQHGVLALRWTWAHDPRRQVDTHGHCELRLAQLCRSLDHLQRLSAEHLTRQTLQAPAVSLRLTTLVHAPWRGDSADWLLTSPSATDPFSLSWSELLERLSARLGDDAVSLLTPISDHRPEHMQHGHPAREGGAVATGRPALAGPPAAPLPTWLLAEPLPLALRGHRPCYQGELQLLAGPQRLEATHWPQAALPDAPPRATVRDYFVARSPQAGLLWVFRVRPGLATGQGPGLAPPTWFLHGVFA